VRLSCLTNLTSQSTLRSPAACGGLLGFEELGDRLVSERLDLQPCRQSFTSYEARCLTDLTRLSNQATASARAQRNAAMTRSARGPEEPLFAVAVPTLALPSSHRAAGYRSRCSAAASTSSPELARDVIGIDAALRGADWPNDGSDPSSLPVLSHNPIGWLVDGDEKADTGRKQPRPGMSQKIRSPSLSH
jgi:hypothetical protein